MVKVIEDKWGKAKEHDLVELIANEISGNLDDGIVEAARQTADGAAMAVARMLDLLVSKQVISLDEALVVAGFQKWHNEIRLAPEAS